MHIKTALYRCQYSMKVWKFLSLIFKINAHLMYTSNYFLLFEIMPLLAKLTLQSPLIFGLFSELYEGMENFVFFKISALSNGFFFK